MAIAIATTMANGNNHNNSDKSALVELCIDRDRHFSPSCMLCTPLSDMSWDAINMCPEMDGNGIRGEEGDRTQPIPTNTKTSTTGTESPTK